MFEKQTLIRVMEKKFTQRPFYPVEYAGIYLIQDDDHYEGHNLLDNDNFPDQAEYNAKLMAAAPDLLEACLTAKAMYEAQGINENSRIGGEQYKELLGAIKKALE